MRPPMLHGLKQQHDLSRRIFQSIKEYTKGSGSNIQSCDTSDSETLSTIIALMKLVTPLLLCISCTRQFVYSKRSRVTGESCSSVLQTCHTSELSKSPGRSTTWREKRRYCRTATQYSPLYVLSVLHFVGGTCAVAFSIFC